MNLLIISDKNYYTKYLFERLIYNVAKSELALSGIKVLDISNGYAGGYCTKVLRDLGADVIKVEIPEIGDICRSFGPFFNNDPNIETSAPHLYLNAGKKSITLDVTNPEAKDVFLKLCAESDVLVENFKPGLMGQMGFQYQELSTSNPGLIMCSLTYFGQFGPYSNFEGSDIVSYAMSGYMYLTGDEDKEPMKAGGRQAEYQCGLAGSMSIIAALIARSLSGHGDHIDVSATEALTSTFDGVAYFQTYHKTGSDPTRAGTRLITREPTGAYPSTLLPCKDGWVHVHYSPSNPEGIGFLTRNERLADDEIMSRMREHADEIDDLITEWLRDHTREEVQTLAQEVRVPFTMVQSIEETMSDPQNKHRNFFAPIEHEVVGKMSYPTSPFRLKTAEWEALPAPILGQNNHQVYEKDLKLHASKIAGLKSKGVM